MYNIRKSPVAGQYFCVHDVGSLAAVNTESDILWIATAQRRHVQLTATEQWLLEHYHARKSLTYALLMDMANAGLRPTGNCRVNGRPASVGDTKMRGLNSTVSTLPL